VIDEAVEAGKSTLKINSLIILAITIVILILFAIFGSGSNSSLTGASITGASTGPSVDVASDVIETTTISGFGNLKELDKYDLILNIVKLKGLDRAENKLQFAEKVSKIAVYTDKLNTPKVTKGWKESVECFKGDCTPEYYALVEMVLEEAFGSTADTGVIKSIFSSESKYQFMPALLQHILNLNVYVERDDLIETSKTMVAVNDLVNKVQSTEVTATWNDLVACDLKCPLYDNLLVQLTQIKIQALRE